MQHVSAALRRILGVILLSVCVGAPMAEMFDRWDHTARDGNDTESNLVVVAVCIGLGFVAAAAMLGRVRPPRGAYSRVRALPLFLGLTRISAVAPTAHGSPPLSVLRV